MFPISFAEYYTRGFGQEVLALAKEKGTAVLSIKTLHSGAWPQGANQTCFTRFDATAHPSLMRPSQAMREWMVLSLWAMVVGGVAVAQTNPLPCIAPTDATNYLGMHVVVTGKVVQAVHRPTVILLNLNQRYPDSPLTCVIRGGDTNKFAEAEDFLGRPIEVTGRIIDYQGRPEIILTSTNQIKVLGAPSFNVSPTPPTPEPAAGNPSPTPATALAMTREQAPTAVNQPDRATGWVVGALALIVVLLLLLVFASWRRDPGRRLRPDSTLALARPTGGPDDGCTSVEEWKQRALVAEAMAGQQGQMLRERIMPELTEFAKQSLVQGLYAQRNALIEKQQKAQLAVEELEQRLTALQLPLQERIRAYEKRIAELEQEVETQGEEMRELTRTTLELLRRKIADERGLERARPPFN